jgi:MFS family permease
LHLPGVYLGRALQGFGEACLYTGAATWAVELAGVERSSQALGYVSSAIWGGISAGPAVGHWLGSFGRAATLQIIAAFVSLLLASFVGETFRPSHGGAPRKLIRPSLLTAGIAVGFVNVHYPVITGFLILHLAQHGNSGPAAFTTYALTILLCRFFLGKLPDRLPPSITFYGGLVAMGIGLVMLATGPRPPVAILATGILGLGFSFPWSSIAATVLRRTPANEHGSTISFLSAFYDLFVGMSSVAAGTVASHFGYPAAFSMAAVALFAAAAAGRFVFKPSEKRVTPDQAEEFETVTS